MCEVSILRITILVEHISPHSLYAYTTLSARQAGEIKLILENTATWKYWKICMENIEIKSILENTTTWIMVISQICPNMLAMRGYVDLSCIVKTFMIS